MPPRLLAAYVCWKEAVRDLKLELVTVGGLDIVMRTQYVHHAGARVKQLHNFKQVHSSLVEYLLSSMSWNRE